MCFFLQFCFGVLCLGRFFGGFFVFVGLGKSLRVVGLQKKWKSHEKHPLKRTSMSCSGAFSK